MELMAVYVDDMNASFGNMIMCHMMADTTEELLAMVDKIGVNRKWIQYPGTFKEHFDICLSKKAKAIKAGAKQITWRQCGEITLERSKTHPLVYHGSVQDYLKQFQKTKSDSESLLQFPE